MSEEADDKIKVIIELAEAITEGVEPEEASELCNALSKICKSLALSVKRPIARWGLRLASSVLEDQADELAPTKEPKQTENSTT